jgi:hypothetical protein
MLPPPGQSAAMATRSSPAASTASITVITSEVPPEPTLSAWSSNIAGALFTARAVSIDARSPRGR